MLRIVGKWKINGLFKVVLNGIYYA